MKKIIFILALSISYYDLPASSPQDMLSRSVHKDGRSVYKHTNVFLDNEEAISNVQSVKREISLETEGYIASYESRYADSGLSAQEVQSRALVHAFLDKCCLNLPQHIRQDNNGCVFLHPWEGDGHDRINFSKKYRDQRNNCSVNIYSHLLNIAKTNCGRELLRAHIQAYSDNLTYNRIVISTICDGAFCNPDHSYNSRSKVTLVAFQYEPHIHSPECGQNSDLELDIHASKRDVTLFHELTHALHLVEKREGYLNRLNQQYVAADLFTRPQDNQVAINRRSILPHEITHTVVLRNEIKEFITNDEEAYTIFGFVYDSNERILKRDYICENAFTAELYNRIRLTHRGYRENQFAPLNQIPLNPALAQFRSNETKSIKSGSVPEYLRPRFVRCISPSPEKRVMFLPSLPPPPSPSPVVTPVSGQDNHIGTPESERAVLPPPPPSPSPVAAEERGITPPTQSPVPVTTISPERQNQIAQSPVSEPNVSADNTSHERELQQGTVRRFLRKIGNACTNIGKAVFNHTVRPVVGIFKR